MISKPVLKSFYLMTKEKNTFHFKVTDDSIKTPPPKEFLSFLIQFLFISIAITLNYRNMYDFEHNLGIKKISEK